MTRSVTVNFIFTVYVDIGSASTDTAMLDFTFASSSSSTRQFEIKATQIPCGANYGAPSGCLQYHTTLTGMIQTFNYQNSATQQHLATQE